MQVQTPPLAQHDPSPPHLCSQNDETISRVAQCPVILIHLSDGEITAHVHVNDKKPSRVARHDLIPEVVNAPRSAEWAVLLQVPAHRQPRPHERMRVMHVCGVCVKMSWIVPNMYVGR